MYRHYLLVFSSTKKTNNIDKADIRKIKHPAVKNCPTKNAQSTPIQKFSCSPDSQTLSQSASAIFRILSAQPLQFQGLLSLPSLSNSLLCHRLWAKRVLAFQYIPVTCRQQGSMSGLHFYLPFHLIKPLSTALNVSSKVWKECRSEEKNRSPHCLMGGSELACLIVIPP